MNGPCTISSDDVVLTRLSCREALEGRELSPEEEGLEVELTTIIPNPSEEHFTMFIHSRENKQVDITISDINGKIVQASRIDTNEPFRFGVDFSAGVYVVKVHKTGDLFETHRIVKIR